MPINSTAATFIAHITDRLDRLRGQADAIRLSTLKMCVYLHVGHNETLRVRCLDACIGAGLLTSPVETLNDDVLKVIEETRNNDEHRFDPQLAICRRIAILEGRRRGLSIDDADDVAQDACLSLWAALVAGKAIKSIGGWARTTAARRIIDAHRKTSSPKRGGGIVESLSNHLDESAFVRPV
jgi:Sigma-70 region 2